MIELYGPASSARIMLDEVDEAVIAQTYSILRSGAFDGSRIRIMPDAHIGKGAVVGFTAVLNDKIIPNVVGTDIGCGISSWNLGPVQLSFPEVDKIIHETVPSGARVHEKAARKLERARGNCLVRNGVDLLEEISKKTGLERDLAKNGLGTLGGGNHFIEIGRNDSNGDVWLTVHTGSRFFGKAIAEYYQKSAYEWCRGSAVKFESGLEYLPLQHGGAQYLEDMQAAQEYAQLNRSIILTSIIEELFPGTPPENIVAEKITSVHNYISLEENIVRKGAIQAARGQEILIPFNMRDGIAVCRGKGNAEWNNSAPHGAGRIASRGKAKASLNLDDYKRAMEGIYSSCVSYSTIDESPMAYKDMGKIIDAIEPAAELQFIIRPLYNFKAC